MVSQWSPADSLTDSYTVHWTIVFDGNGYKAMSALARIDGQAYRLMGPECPPGMTPPLPQIGHPRVYPTSTVYSFLGAGVSLNLTFTQPLVDGVDRGVLVPLSYVTYDVAPVDGASHTVQVYLDLTAQLVVNTDVENVTWDRVNTTTRMAAAGGPPTPTATTTPYPPGSTVLRTGNADQTPFRGYGDDYRIQWGFLYAAAVPQDPGVGVGDGGWGGTSSTVLSSMASSNLMRYAFVTSPANGTLSLPPDEVIMPVQACTNPQTGQAICACQVPGETGAKNDWPALGLAWDMGTVAPGTSASRFAAVAYDDLYAARFFGLNELGWWRSTGRTVDDLLANALSQYPSIMDGAVARDYAVVTALRGAGLGEAYERISSLAYRQTFADNKLAYYDGSFGGQTLPGMHMWVKGCASSGDTGTMDDNLPAFPLYLLTFPELVPAFLSPLLMWGRNETYAGPDAPFPRNMTYNFPFAPHYLGQNPDAELQCWDWTNPLSQCEPMPIEMSADALLLYAAYALQTGDYLPVEDHWPQLASYSAYLVANGLFPGSQRSTDDYEGFIVNSTHLSLKSILAIGAFAQLANATGRGDDGAAAWATALAYRDTWMALAVDPTSNGTHSMLTFAQPGSRSIKYSLLFDVALGLDLFPASFVQSECEYHRQNALPYGWILQKPASGGNTWTNVGWEGWIAAVCDEETSSDLVSRIFSFLNATDRRVAFTDWHDAQTAAFQGFTARAQVGGMFAPLWVRQLRERRRRSGGGGVGGAGGQRR
jgi:hypothetical protein